MMESIRQVRVAPNRAGELRAMPASARRCVVPALAFILMSGVITYRIADNLNVPGQPRLPYYAFMDFRDSFYYPIVALLDGHNPYAAADYMQTYPVARVFSPYPPLAMLLHAPFSLLPLRAAEAAYHAVSLALVLLLAFLSLRFLRDDVAPEHVLWLATLILMSHPAHMSLFLGQCTLFVVVGTYVALLFGRSRPWLAALGFAVTCLKPTFGAPLALLLLTRREAATAFRGATIAALASLPFGIALVRVAGGVGPLLASFRETYQLHVSADATAPASSFIRLDTPAFFGRLFVDMGPGAELTVTVALLALGLVTVWRVTGSGADRRGVRSATIICMTMLACLYHAAYDALLLTLPLTALATDFWHARGPRAQRFRWLVLALLAVPAANYVSSSVALKFLQLTGLPWLVINSLNGGAILAAFTICVALSIRRTETA